MSAAPRRPWAASPWLLYAALFCAVLFAACRKDPAPARFPHQFHLAGGFSCGKPGQPDCLSCATCHAVSHQTFTDRMPEQALCAGCHENDLERVNAVLAITPSRPHGEIHIDHDKHLALDGIQGQCVPCHAGVVDLKKLLLSSMS